jgi:hypothetical protein
MLQFLALPYIEVFVERGANDSILDSRIEMPRTTKDEVLSAHMADEFKIAKGDPIATIDVMMKGYNSQYKKAKKDLVKLVKSIENVAAAARDATDDCQEEAEDQAHAIVLTAIRNETQKCNITEFAAMVDDKYRQKLENCVDWSVATSYLLSDNDIMEIYNEFQRRFPLVHMTLAAIVSTRYYSVPLSMFNIEMNNNPNDSDDDEDQEFDAPVLHKKQRMILFTFFASLCTRSCYLIKHWACVESLGYFFRGFHQPGRKSFTGAFIQGLRTSWKDQNAIYDRMISTFHEKLRSEDILTAAFDNFQKVIPKKNITGSKGAVVHIGTSLVLKRNKPLHVVEQSRFVSEHGVSFKITSVTRHDMYHYFLKGELDDVWKDVAVIPTLPSGVKLNIEMIKADKELIVGGFVWPKSGWVMTFMPGFQPRPEVTHHKQIIPPPHRGYIDSSASDEDILFSKDSCLRTFDSKNACSFTTERMASIHHTSKRINELSDYADFLKEHNDNDKRSNDLVSGMSKVSKLLYRVKQFETNLVRHVNPDAGTVDQCFTAPVIHHDETSRKGMMKTFLEIAKHLQLLTYELNGSMIGKAKLLPNALKRTINLQVDALSSQNFRSLLLHFSKKLTELSSSTHVLAIIRALKRITCQHDYLHEIRMHRQDVIWRTFYGGFLQPLVVHLGWRRITGNPVKKGLQQHENFLIVPYPRSFVTNF